LKVTVGESGGRVQHSQSPNRAFTLALLSISLVDRDDLFPKIVARKVIEIFGPENYAYRLGLIGAPSRICQALAPLAFGLLLEPMGRLVVVVSAGLSLAALVSLMALRRTETAEAIPRAAE
jgi:hypothetical protein